ncbi:MAG: magnesium transporter [Methylobacter sp.]|nr:magnesium transporter [Methylobacter sp.]MDP2099135.1 magnesium transporter [Methylobacter sp.]MDP2429961.1 magnesium transporter [Methylobacter sp.]MDP3054806.1 magnesium transporter [Methylobacter sp.]MDP3361210.1 magnesium transporter [Methylobacter sp.]
MSTAILNAYLRHAIERKDYLAVRQFLSEFQAVDLADLLQLESIENAHELLTYLPDEQRADAFGHLPASRQQQLATAMADDEVSQLLRHLDADEGADLLHLLPEQRHDRVLRSIARKERENLRRLAGHQESTAGAIMTCDYATVPADVTVGKALTIVRSTAPDVELIYQLYVVDAHHHLLGTLSLRELILSAPGACIRDLMTTDLITIPVMDDQERAAKLISRYDLMSLPVVDDDNRLVGIITYDDAMDVAEAEATEDIHKGATVSHLAVNFRDAHFFTLYRKRILWLLLLVFGNLFSGAGIAYFEDIIATYVVLVFFLPLLIDSGGNAGSQAATLVIRSIATGDTNLRDWGKLLKKELIVATGLGLTMAAAVSLIGAYRGGPDIALVVALSMICTVLAGSLVGLCLPFMLIRFGFDPATASTPLVTTIADAAGVVIYFWIATLVLHLPAP